MIGYTVKTKSVRSVSNITCDICGKMYNVDNFTEIDNFTHIEGVGGYGSIYGDGVEITCDICQHCLIDKLGEYIRYG